MDFGESALDYDTIDLGERSPLAASSPPGSTPKPGLSLGLSKPEMPTSVTWCGPISNLLVVAVNSPNSVVHVLLLRKSVNMFRDNWHLDLLEMKLISENRTLGIFQ